MSLGVVQNGQPGEIIRLPRGNVSNSYRTDVETCRLSSLLFIDLLILLLYYSCVETFQQTKFNA